MRFPSYNIPSGASFLDVVRLVDKVQAKVTSHLLDEQDLRKSFAWATDTWANTVGQVVVEVFGGFSFKGFKFASACTYLYLRGHLGTIEQGCVKRSTAPEREYGRGARYVIALQRVTGEITVPTGFRMTDFDRDHLGAHLVLESAPQRTT